MGVKHQGHPVKDSINVRFGIAAVLTSAGCALLLAGVERAGILFGLAVIFFMPRSELTQSVPRRELWVMFWALLALIATSVVAKHFLPSSAGDAVRRVIFHAAFVVPFWMLMMWGLSRNYRRQKGGDNV
jgi:hypothetical protein